MGAIVAFDYNSFISQYPEFAYIQAPQVETYWNIATIYCRVDGGGPVPTAALVTSLANMLTAHIAYLFAPSPSGIPNSTIVGRISNASEGSVSVGVENQYPPGTPQWYQQSKYGSLYWAATAPYRTMRYIPSPMRIFNPWPYG